MIAREVTVAVALAILTPLAAANVTPIAALLPRQSGAAAGSCTQGSDASVSYQDCANNVLEDACLNLSGTPLVQCGCNSAAAIFTCYSTYCAQDATWTEYSSDSSNNCDFFTLTPGPFTPGETVSGVMGGGAAQTAATGAGGGSSPTTTSPTTGSQVTGTQPTQTGASKNSGAIVAPTGYAAALIVGLVGMLVW